MCDLNYLKRSLDCLCKFLDEVYDINSGGCCLISYLIAKHLDNLGIKYELVIYDGERRYIKEISEEISEMTIKSDRNCSVVRGSTCYHYTLRILNSGYINPNHNSDGFFEYRIKKIHSRNIKWIYDNGSWNSYFDVKNSEVIESIIKSFFIFFYYEKRKSKENCQ